MTFRLSRYFESAVIGYQSVYRGYTMVVFALDTVNFLAVFPGCINIHVSSIIAVLQPAFIHFCKFATPCLLQCAGNFIAVDLDDLAATVFTGTAHTVKE